MATPAVTANDVLWYIPNLIGYVRVALMLASFFLAKSNWIVASICYVTAFVGDLADGKAARAFNQSSNFGAVLDMVTDRVSTCGLLIILSQLYPDNGIVFLMLVAIYISSHWFHVISTAKKGHHKSRETLAGRNILMRLYYSVYAFFGYCCVGTEFTYILLYLLFPTHLGNVTLITLPQLPAFTLYHLCYFVCAPACVMKQAINIAQLVSACHSLAEDDAIEKSALAAKSK